MGIRKVSEEEIETLRRVMSQPRRKRPSVRALAREAGISVPHLYRVVGPFKGKGDLYTARVIAEKARAVVELARAGWSHEDIGVAVELNVATVGRIMAKEAAQ